MPRKDWFEIAIEPKKLARLAKLRYVSDSEPGYSRTKNGRGFQYFSCRGVRLRGESEIARIQRLAIPPAWTQVWICRFANGHLQATGVDSRGRKQYLYHERWRSVADSAKFLRLEAFGRLLPVLRKHVGRDLRGNELTRRRVLAGMVAALDATSIRIGNEEYVRANHSYGLSTLRAHHVASEKGQIRLSFRAKGGIRRDALIQDKRLIRLFRQLRRLPGSRVFQYRDSDGELHSADALAVNEYLREVTGRAVTAKDFRTWKASSMAAGRLYDNREMGTAKKRKMVIRNTIAEVAATLGNTSAVCRKSYIHPGLLAAYEAGDLPCFFQRFQSRAKNRVQRDELIFSRFLRRWDPVKLTCHFR